MTTPVSTQWQPIETAPDDQRSILAVHRKSGLMRVCYRDAAGSDRYVIDGCATAGRYWRPTHWMPLPPPPEVSA